MSSVRNSVQSKRYSPTTSSTSLRSAGGNVYCDSIDGVRKHETMTPLSGLTGNVPGTPSTMLCLPRRPRMSHRRGSLTAAPLAMKRPS